MCLLLSHFPDVFIEITSASSLLSQIYTVFNSPVQSHSFLTELFLITLPFIIFCSLTQLILSHKESFIAPNSLISIIFFSSTRLRTKAIHFPSLIPSSSLSNLPKVKVKSLSHVQLFATPWTVAYQAPPSMEFSRQENWSGCHFLLQGIFSTQGSNPGFPHCRQTLYHLSHQGSIDEFDKFIDLFVDLFIDF